MDRELPAGLTCKSGSRSSRETEAECGKPKAGNLRHEGRPSANVVIAFLLFRTFFVLIFSVSLSSFPTFCFSPTFYLLDMDEGSAEGLFRS